MGWGLRFAPNTPQHAARGYAPTPPHDAVELCLNGKNEAVTGSTSVNDVAGLKCQLCPRPVTNKRPQRAFHLRECAGDVCMDKPHWLSALSRGCYHVRSIPTIRFVSPRLRRNKTIVPGALVPEIVAAK